MRQYLTDEAKTYSGIPNLDLTAWTDYVPKDIPQQANGCDCGVFTCKFADYISADLPLDFSQTHMPTFRRRMALEIKLQKVE
jgi:sentrin-specific protease 2 (axin associating molecule)